jgi:hypothetical protein
MLLRFPEERCTVIVLANRGDMNMGLATEVADIVLEGKLKEAPTPPKDKQKADDQKQAEPMTLTAAQQAEYVGEFYSGELDAFYRVAVKDGKLTVRSPKGQGTLEPLGEDRFRPVLGGAGTLHFGRDAEKRVNGFTITTGQIRNLRFDRAEIKLVK